MPYINSDDRELLDKKIEEICDCIFSTIGKTESLDQNEFLGIGGTLNYIITRICSKSMGNVNYAKIATITGVLENVKQEFYRRMASPYEDEKISSNGDVREYGQFEKMIISKFNETN